MAAYKDTLLDKDGNEVYLKTTTDNIFDSEGNRLDNEISSLKENLAKHEIGNPTEITSNFTCPSDGYIQLLVTPNNSYALYLIDGKMQVVVSSHSTFNNIQAVLVRKGTVISNIVLNGNYLTFYPLV